jgi:hypothetical protein
MVKWIINEKKNQIWWRKILSRLMRTFLRSHGCEDIDGGFPSSGLRQCVPPKCWYPATSPQGVTTEKRRRSAIVDEVSSVFNKLSWRFNKLSPFITWSPRVGEEGWKWPKIFKRLSNPGVEVKHPLSGVRKSDWKREQAAGPVPWSTD